MLYMHTCFCPSAHVCMHTDCTQAQRESAITAAAAIATATATVAMCTLCSAIAHVTCLVCADTNNSSSGSDGGHSTQHQAVADSVMYSDILQAVADNSWVCNGCLEQLKLHGRACCDVITAMKRDSHVHAVASTAASK
jgi:hypothetical protein